MGHTRQPSRHHSSESLSLSRPRPRRSLSLARARSLSLARARSSYWCHAIRASCKCGVRDACGRWRGVCQGGGGVCQEGAREFRQGVYVCQVVCAVCCARAVSRVARRATLSSSKAVHASHVTTHHACRIVLAASPASRGRAVRVVRYLQEPRARSATRMRTRTPLRRASSSMRCCSSWRTPLAAASSISCVLSRRLSVPANFSCHRIQYTASRRARA